MGEPNASGLLGSTAKRVCYQLHRARSSALSNIAICHRQKATMVVRDAI
jgi:hypothetical protein